MLTFVLEKKNEKDRRDMGRIRDLGFDLYGEVLKTLPKVVGKWRTGRGNTDRIKSKSTFGGLRDVRWEM